VVESTTWVQSGSAELFVRVWGIEGPPIVALHPGVGDSRIWQWCAPRWVEAGYRVVAHDRRGFGETRYASGSYSDVDDLRMVTAACNARPAVIIGNSMGGRVALDLAVRHPTEVASLVLIAPAPSGYPVDWWVSTDAELEIDSMVDIAEKAGDLDEVNRLEAWHWLDGAGQPEGRVSGAARDLFLAMNRVALDAAPAGDLEAAPPSWPDIGRLDAAISMIVGEHDEIGFSVMAERFAEVAPGSRVVIMDGTAHCPSLDRPDALAELVIGILGG
jgi:pimeloyl-ACP methyl ester carboxylesterase